MSDGPLARYQNLRKKKRERFFERSRLDFKGQIFEVVHPGIRDMFGSRRLLIFDKERGLEYDFEFHRRTGNKPVDIDIGERVIATGKIVAKQVSDRFDFIVGIEVLTTRGIGYMKRTSIMGPLEKTEDGAIKARGRLENKGPK